MAEKKERCKFTIQFNPADPSHQQTVEILNQQGRRKAQFLVNAVMHYLHCSESLEIPQVAPTNTDAIEVIVRRILQEQNTSAPTTPDTSKIKRERHAENIQYEDAADMIGEDGLAAIRNTMALFRT